MFEYAKYDFSTEDKFKKELFSKMKKIYEKSQNRVLKRSDDELSAVAAASTCYENQQCPFVNIRCEECENYIKFNATKTCKLRYIKI